MMVKPFEDAVFGAKQGEIAGRWRASSASTCIRVTGIQAAKARAARGGAHGDRGRADAGRRRQRKFAEAAETFTNMVYEQADSLKPAAERFKLQVQTTGWIAKSARQELGALDNPEAAGGAVLVRRASRTSATPTRSRWRPATLVAARVLEHQPAAQRSFEEVKGEIAEMLRQREASTLAQKDGKAKLEQLRKGKDAGVKWARRARCRAATRRACRATCCARCSRRRDQAAGLRRRRRSPDAGYSLVRISKVIEAEVEGARRRRRRQRAAALLRRGAVRGLRRQPAQPRRHRACRAGRRLEKK